MPARSPTGPHPFHHATTTYSNFLWIMLVKIEYG